jgi:hypothetical protein
MARVPVNDKILGKAGELLESWKSSGTRAMLRRIVRGQVKSVDVDWWRTVCGCTDAQIKTSLRRKASNAIAKIEAMADPNRNPNRHERETAKRKLAEQKAKLEREIESARAVSPPGLEEYDRERARRKEALDRINAGMREAFMAKAESRPRPEPKSRVNTTGPRPESTTDGKKPRSADRHREPNRDRHRPGYMRDYMRRWRAAQKRM